LGLKLITPPSSAQVRNEWKPPVCVYGVDRENLTCALYIYIYIYMYMCVCVCVCVCNMPYLLQCLPVTSLEKYELRSSSLRRPVTSSLLVAHIFFPGSLILKTPSIYVLCFMREAKFYADKSDRFWR